MFKYKNLLLFIPRIFTPRIFMPCILLLILSGCSFTGKHTRGNLADNQIEITKSGDIIKYPPKIEKNLSTPPAIQQQQITTQLPS